MKTNHCIRLISRSTSNRLLFAIKNATSTREKILKSYPAASFIGAMRGSPHFQSWAETFYRRPHPELLPGAILDLIMTPGAATGTSSLPVAIFLAEIINRLVHRRPEDGVLIIESLIASIESEQSRMTNNTAFADEALEKADTVLRAFFLADTPACDLILENAVIQWANAFETINGLKREQMSGLGALGRSFLPPKENRNRKKLHEWPIPVMNLALFERNLTQNEYPFYGCTRYWFMHTHALYSSSFLSKSLLTAPSQTESTKAEALRHAGRIKVMSPILAQDLTVSMVDALWSSFYVTGNSACIFRVLDIATLYVEFLEDPGIGDMYLIPSNNPETIQSGTLLPSPPPDLLDDPLSLMRFQASRHALYTLFQHISSHTNVGPFVLKHHEELEDKVDITGSLPTGESTFTSFGEKRLALLRHFRSTFTQLSEQAEKDGIGSGVWPECMKSLFNISDESNKTSKNLIDDGSNHNYSHHSAPRGEEEEKADINHRNSPTNDLTSTIRPVKDMSLSPRRSAGKQRR